MAKIPDKFTYPFCYTPDPMVVEAAEGLIARIDADEKLHALFAEGKMMGVLMVQDSALSGDAGKAAPETGSKTGSAHGSETGTETGSDVHFLYGFSGLAGGRSIIEGFVPPIFDTTAVNINATSHEDSIRLQNWLFDQYVVMNACGETRTIREIFADRGLVPPGGTGDCAAPKLLQYAYSHGLKPLAMGEFWYGASPASEVRRQGCFYPSCTGKCGPLLGFMMRGLDVEPNPLDNDNLWSLSEPVVRYEDSWLIVVEKPSGMLSVPGRTSRRCLVDWLEDYCRAGKSSATANTSTTSTDTMTGSAAETATDLTAAAATAATKTDTAAGIEKETKTESKTDFGADPKAEGRRNLPREATSTTDTTIFPVHRLDMDTSGLMVYAKTPEVQVELRRQFEEREVRKQYLAHLCPAGHAPDTAAEAEGRTGSGTAAGSAAAGGRKTILKPGDSGKIALPLMLDYYDRPRQKVDFKEGKPAVTGYEILRELPGGGLEVRFTPFTGRTHQLRVHAAHILGLGRPIIGDRLYGGQVAGASASAGANAGTGAAAFSDEPAAAGNAASRLMLHASLLSFRHPVSGSRMHFTSGFPVADAQPKTTGCFCSRGHNSAESE